MKGIETFPSLDLLPRALFKRPLPRNEGD